MSAITPRFEPLEGAFTGSYQRHEVSAEAQQIREECARIGEYTVEGCHGEDQSSLAPLFQALGECSHLGTLNIKECDLDTEAATALVQAIKKMDQLCQLHITHSQLSSSFGKELASALEGKNQLSLLNLSHNPLGNTGALAIAQYAASYPLLQKLNLQGCQVDEQGSAQLLEALHTEEGKRASLYDLNLNHNPISDQGCQTLAQLLQERDKLQEVHLDNCGVGDTSVEKLLQSLPSIQNRNLHLFLASNPISEKGVETIKSALNQTALLQNQLQKVEADWRKNRRQYIAEGVSKQALIREAKENLPTGGGMKTVYLRALGKKETHIWCSRPNEEARLFPLAPLARVPTFSPNSKGERAELLD